MKRQQWLLPIMTSIIVVLAIVIGVDLLVESARGASQDQIRMAAAKVAVRAQAWLRCPADQGGGGGSFEKFSLGSVQYDSSTVPGDLAISERRPGSFRLIGALHGDSTWALIMEVYPDSVVFVQ